MNSEKLKNAAKIIKEGGVVAFPTETFYGLAVDPMNSKALSRLVKIKGRDAAKGIPVIAADHGVVSTYFKVLDEHAAWLGNIWPAPLSVALSPGKKVPVLLGGDFDTVAVRVSDLKIARELARLSNGLITATSANLSGEPPVTTAAALSLEIVSKVDCVLDGGTTPGGLPSTIIGFHEAGYRIFREGAYPLEQLEAELKAP